MLLLMDSTRHAGCSTVCLDLNVGLSPPPPPRDTETEEPYCPAGRRAAAPVTDEEANKALEAKLTRVNEENRRLTEMIIAHLYPKMIARPASPTPAAAGNKRGRESPDPSCNSCGGGNNRKCAADGAESPVPALSVDGASCKRIKVRRVCTRTDPADDTTLAVKDGYRWRKYGQKVTRANPSPRAYFRCAFAHHPSCPVKKKVQRSAEDGSVLVATYEGEHNHPRPTTRAGKLPGSAPRFISVNSSGPTITLDLIKNDVRVLEATEEAPEPDLKKLCREIASPEFRTALADRMAGALTGDSNFTSAVAAAILRLLPEF